MQSLSGMIMNPEFKIEKTNLIEASAGTGKTYSIQTLFLRMVIVEGIPVQEILVVTFTEAATKELRERLHAVLDKCRKSIDGVLADNDEDAGRINEIMALDVKNIPDAYSEKGEAYIQVRRIRRALLDFDQSSIYTIHGFCQRTLVEFAFECNHDFDTDVVNGDGLLLQLCADWWRQINYGKSKNIFDQILKSSSVRKEELIELVKAIAMRPMAKKLPMENDQERKLYELINLSIGNLVKRRKIIESDIAYDVKANKITIRKGEDILKCIDNLCAEPRPKEHVAFELLQSINDYPPTSEIQTSYNAPVAVQKIIDAAKVCQRLVKTHGIGMTKKGYTKTDGVAGWEEAINDVTAAVKAGYGQLVEVLDNQLDNYEKTEFSDQEKKEKILVALNQYTSDGVLRPGGDLKTAINKLASLQKINELAILESEIISIAEIKGAEAVVAKYDQAKRDAYEMTFDDMPQRLQKILTRKDSDGNSVTTPLHVALRKKYQVGLIDEFQDTDPIQYAVFNEIFAAAGKPLFYVGDPKQAIYSFRGGDIFTYAKAAGAVDKNKRYNLDKNYRSQDMIIAAINTIFMDRKVGACVSDGAGSVDIKIAKQISGDSFVTKSVFGTDEICYPQELKCQGLKTTFRDGGEKENQVNRPFKIWKYNKKSKMPTSSFSSEAHIIYNDVANEIVRLLNDKDSGFIEVGKSLKASKTFRRVKPSDIAILVKRHNEALALYQALSKRGVPVVRQATDNIFDLEEAVNLLYLLKAMVTPESISTVRTALASSLIPVNDSEISALSNDEIITEYRAVDMGINNLPDSMEAWIILFKEIKDLWLRKNFSSAFLRLVRKVGMNANLASLPTGERKIVNVRQLHDLIHQVSTERHLGMESVLKWFTRQLERETREENTAFETRLESDADAVQIMTIFRSKGLEFPIVFVPTMWTSIVGQSRLKQSYKVYHDDLDGNGMETILHFDLKDKDVKKKADTEKRQEEIRNLYVAVTRASHRTYVVAGDVGSEVKESGECESGINFLMAECMPGDLLSQWGDDPGTGIDVIEKYFEYEPTLKFTDESDSKNRTLKALEAEVDISRGHASFSSISPQGHISINRDVDEVKDFDANTAEKELEPLGISTELDIFSFPAGAQTGSCWHAIFEFIDFTGDDEHLKDVIHTQLSLFRLDKGDPEIAKLKREITFQMVKNVLQASINVGGDIIKLSDVSEKQKLAEMDFNFSLNLNPMKSNRNSIFEVLFAEWKDMPDNSDEKLFLERLQSWEAEIPNGFMTGSVDLVFKQNDKYYILDWKSNCLNRTAESFHRGGLVAEIASHSYFLQYLIYTVAVHCYLKQSLGNDYNYDRDFGGVIYLFLRGVNQNDDKENQNGLFYTRPKRALIEKLAVALMGTR